MERLLPPSPFRPLATLLLQSVDCRVIILRLHYLLVMHQHSNMSMGTRIVLLSSIAFYDRWVRDGDDTCQDRD